MTSVDDVTVPVSEALRRARENGSRANAYGGGGGGGAESASWRAAMAFGGWAPETINGRSAMVGFVIGEAAKRATGEGIVTLAHDHVVSVAAVLAVVTLASFAPSAFGVDYTGNPRSKSDGIFTAKIEKIHGRLAMMGILYEVATELSARGFF